MFPYILRYMTTIATVKNYLRTRDIARIQKDTMNVVEYLEKEGIKWFYINLSIENKRKVLDVYPIEGRRPDMNDFKEDEIVRRRQGVAYKSPYIAIDTSVVYQIDVDTVDEKGEPMVPPECLTMSEEWPHFLSTTKSLPHFFVRPNENRSIKAVRVPNVMVNDVELLCGQWSWCLADRVVWNYEKKTATLNDEFYDLFVDKKREPLDRVVRRDVDMTEIVRLMESCISRSRAEKYDTWLEIGMCLHNIDNSSDGECFRLWDEFSRSSDKYRVGECERKWRSFKNGGLSAGSLYYFAKHDNPMEWGKILSDRVVDDIRSFDASHNALAGIVHKMFKDEFVCATADGKLWYHYTGHRWKEDVEHLELRRCMSNRLLKQYDRAYQVVHEDASFDEMDSDAGSNTTLNLKRKKINRIRDKLKDHTCKKNIIAECTEYFYDESFLERLDADPNLLGFNNGVYHLKEREFVPSNPRDCVSLTVGYDYVAERDTAKYGIVEDYFAKLHPVKEQREYYLKTMSRQLYGDSGMELFHIHAGLNGSAGGGKTKSWEINKFCLGDYVQKFDVAYLVNSKRKDGSAPSPEYKCWKGRRMLYCTEPNYGETINSGIMKDLTGGERIVYRMLFSNHFDQYIPQFKIHVMTNDLPQIDGTDEGVKRRARVLPYVSKFVTDASDVNETGYRYLADTEVTHKFRDDDELKMEYMRYLLDWYDHKWKYTMSKVVREASVQYLSDNDDIGRFVADCLVRKKDGHITLKQIKEIIKSGDYKEIKSSTLKTRLERVMGTKCLDQHRFGKTNVKNVFMGYIDKNDFEDQNSGEE